MRHLLLGFAFCSPAFAAGPSSQNFVTTFVALVLVVCLIFLLGKLLKRMQGNVMGGGKSKLKIISQLALGQKERLVVLDVNGKQILIGVTSMQINLLMELENPIIETERNLSFTSQFQQMIRKNDAS